MSILKQLSLVATVMTMLGTVGIAPVRALYINFGVEGMNGSVRIDNSLIQSGATQFNRDEIDFSFNDRDFLSTTTASGISASLIDELGTSGFLNFAIDSSDVWTDEPWGVRFPNTLYAGTIAWGVPGYSGNFGWINRPQRVVGAILPGGSPPDRVSPITGLGIWYSPPLQDGSSSDFFVYASDFLTSDQEPPTSVPEPSSLLGLLLLGGSWLLGNKFLKNRTCG